MSDRLELTEPQRIRLHEVLMQHWVQRERDEKRGIGGPGLIVSDDQLMQLLRLTRARAVVAS